MIRRVGIPAGLTRRFARRLVADATVMSIRAVGRHHGVGWHRIMGLVRAHSERVAQRRRARPCRVLLVDETSIRRRHRYVTTANGTGVAQRVCLGVAVRSYIPPSSAILTIRCGRVW